MNRFRVACILSLVIILFASCGPKDDANTLIDTQFASEVVDSCHILSPKTYSYLHNIKPPLGIKSVVVVVEQIENEQMGTFADNLFKQYSKKKYSGNTFKQRGILIVASQNPQLVQVRVGETYDVYCRMRGSAAGEDYLAMQKETPNIGIDEICPIALQNVIKDIEQCRKLPWYKKVAIKMSFEHIEMFLDDVATPSESFFSQFYFRPFLYIVGTIKSIFGNWVLSFLFISVVYILTKQWAEGKIDAYVGKKAKEHSNGEDDFLLYLGLYSNIKDIVFFIIKLILTIPTIAAISILSTSRMEDIIVLRDANIPSVELMEDITHWSNSTPGILLVLSLMIVYYCKFLLSLRQFVYWGLLSNRQQQVIYNKNNILRQLTDNIITKGVNRNILCKLFMRIICHVVSMFTHHNFQEINYTVIETPEVTDEKGKPAKSLFDHFFLDATSPLYKPKSVIRISLCRTAKRNPLIFPI